MVDFVNTNDTQEQPEALVNIDTSLQNTEVPLSPEIASTRAYKAAFAVPDKSYDDYYTAFVNGQEKSVERETAANVDAKKYKDKAAQLNDYFNKFDALPPEQQDYVRNHTDVGNLVTIKKTDPDSVFQEFYAGNYLKTLYDSAARNPDSWFNDAVAQYPKVVNDEINKGAEHVSKREFTEKYAQDIKDILDKQGWTELLGFPIPLSISSATDFVKMAVPFYNQAKERGLVPNTDDTLLLGNNLEVQTRALLTLPFDEYKAAVVPILEKLKKDNPSMAMIFAGALLGQSTEEVTMNNLQSILDPVAALGSIAGAVNTVNRLRGAIRRVVKSSANPIVGPATRLEAVGDVEQAAVKQATADTVHMLQGTLDPAKEAVEALPSNIRLADPAESNLYRDSVQKIKELAGPEMGPLMEHIDRAVKIERVDFTSATEAQFQQIAKESIQRNFRGHENDITDVTKPYWEHETGRWMQDVVFTNGGKLFPEATAAEAYKALNRFNDAKVVEEGGGLYSVRMQVPTKEDSPGVRAIRKNNAPAEPTGLYATFKDAVTSAISRIRTPDESLPLEQNVDRKTLIYGRNKLIDFMQNAAEDIANLASFYKSKGAAEDRAVTGFQTSLGSTYQLHSDGTTVRNKAARNLPGHVGDSGFKPRSAKTVYVDPQDAQRLATPQGRWRIVDHADGTVSLLTPNPKTGWGISPTARNVPITSVPEVGKVPIELFSPGDIKGLTTFKNVHFGNEIVSVEQSNISSGSRFSGHRWEDFNSIVKLARDHIDPATGKPGYFFKNETELNDAYLRHIKRLPNELETKAYSAFRKVMEYAKVLQNYSDFKNKSRLGAQTFQVSLKEADGTKTLSPKFDAVPVDHLPGGDDAVMIITGGGKRGTEEVRSLNGLGPKALRDLEQAVKEGKVQVLQTTNPEAQPFLGFSKSVGKGHWIKYVVSDNVDRFNLQWGAIKESPGGFFGTEYPKYIAQADVKFDPSIQRYRYWGDKTAMPMENGGIGKDVMDQMNKVREMIKESRKSGGALSPQQTNQVIANRKALADIRKTVSDPIERQRDPAKVAHLEAQGRSIEDWLIKNSSMKAVREAAIKAEANKLPIPDFVNWFKNAKDETGKVIPARYNVNEPFHMVGKNEMVGDVDKGLPERYVKTNAKGTKVDMFRDGTKEGVYSLKVRPDFSEPRDPFDFHTIRNEQGTRANPSYTYEPAQTVDPITMMNRALTRIVNSVYMDDYKAASVEQWLAKAGSKLKVDQRFLEAAPYYYFYNKQEYLPGTPLKMQMQLDNFRYQVKQLIGEPTKIDTWLHQTAQQMADATYGGKYQIDPWWVLPGIADGARYSRGVAFHSTMGVLALPQVMLQASSVVNLVPLAGPTRAYAGVGGASLYLKAFLSRDPKVIDHMDMIASKMGMFRPGEWKELLQILDNTGFQKVGTDHVFKEVAPSVIPGAGILDLSSIFFTGGEKMNKVSAFFAAGKEFRDAHPTGPITNRDVQNIINRADLFSGNMSISSKSMIEKGIFSFPMQFLTYPLRMAELMLGHRIDAATKAKMVGTMALLYGVPASMNVWGAPVSDWITKKAQEYGYAAGKSTAADFLMQGAVSTIIALLSADDPSKVQEKDFMNIPQKFGPSGVSILKDLYDNDKGILKVAAGATGSVFGGILGSATPFLRFASTFGDYPITSDDMTDTLASLAQTASKGKQLAYAMNYGRWLNKNEVFQGEVSKTKAFAAFITGLQPLDVVNSNTRVNTLTDEKDGQLDALKEFTKEIHRMMYNDIDGNRGQAEKNVARAKAILELSGYPHERWNQALASAKKSFDQSQVERVNWQYYFDKVNENRAPRALETGREILQRRR